MSSRMTNANEIIEAALTLPPEARAQIADQLLASLDPAQTEVDAAWEPEIERRVREIEDGRVQLIPHDQVMSHVREHLRSLRGK